MYRIIRVQMLWVCESRVIHGESVGNSPCSVSWGLPLVCTVVERQIFLLLLLDGFTSVPQNSLPSNSQRERKASVTCLGLGEEKGLWSVMILLFHHKGTDALNIASVGSCSHCHRAAVLVQLDCAANLATQVEK